MTPYSPSDALMGAVHRINNPPTVMNTQHQEVNTKYEHHVATWACTKLKEVFSDEKWAITPEQRDSNTDKKPDFVVEEAIRNNDGRTVQLWPYLCMELKKVGGDRMEKALDQLCKAIHKTVYYKGNTSDDEFEVFAVVQVGLDIGFFEYHFDESNLEEEGIPHFRGCVSLTEDYLLGEEMTKPVANKPNDLNMLYFNTDRLGQELDNPDDQETRDEAKKYTTPCIYNLERHQQEIHDIFLNMADNKPRSSW